MKRRLLLTLGALACAILVPAAQAATVTVTTVDDGVSNIGSPGTFYWALTNAQAGDTIAFNILGAGPHYLQIPPGGFPLVYKRHNLTIDGYTQPGSSPNSNPITGANNAVIKVVIDGRNGNSRNMEYVFYDGSLASSDPPIDNTSIATQRGGFGNDERALLGIYRSTNVTVRGLAFLATQTDPNGVSKGICLAHDYEYDTTVHARETYYAGSTMGFHVNGCWFGVDPTNQTIAGVSGGAMALAAYRHRDTSGGPRPELPNIGLTVGVRKGAANPRAEFNVFVGYGYVMDCENIRTRMSGNFINVMPDGVTSLNAAEVDPGGWYGLGAIGGLLEWGRYDDTEPMIIGTDGDGVNDGDEGNIFGPVTPYLGLSPTYALDFYSTSRKPYVIAGNRFGVAGNGTVWTNNSMIILGAGIFGSGTQVRFGTDGNGVSDDLEANYVYNNHIFADLFPTPTSRTYSLPSMFLGMDSAGFGNKDSWLSSRGNIMVNCGPTLNPDDVDPDWMKSGTNYLGWWSNYVANPVNVAATVPTLSGASTISSISGTFATPNPASYFTNGAIVDIYEADPEGLANGALFAMPSFPSGFPQGKKLLGSFLDNGPYDSNPAVGAFTFNTSALAIPHGTKITAAVTYSSFARPNLTAITHSGTATTLTWTGSNGGPYLSPQNGRGGPSSGFGVQRASSPSGPWTTSYASGNSATISDSSPAAFYRVVAPVAGMTTLFANPVTLP